MGWLWSSTPNPEPPSDPLQSANPPDAVDDSTPRPLPQQDTPSPASPQVIPPQSEIETHKADLIEIFQSLQPPPPSALQKSRTLKPPPSDDPNDDSTPELTPPLRPQHIYPSTLSARTLFDGAFYCQSPGGQFMNVYRYGVFKDCGQHWRDFWWTLRVNRGFFNAQAREEKMLKRGWEREQRLKRAEAGTSDDVWRQRKRLRPGMFGERWHAGVGEEGDEQFDIGEWEEDGSNADGGVEH